MSDPLGLGREIPMECHVCGEEFRGDNAEEKYDKHVEAHKAGDA